MATIDSPGAIRRTNATERRAQVTNWMILAILVYFVVTYAMQWYRISQALKIESITISNVRVVGPALLCPGDMLIVRYDLEVRGFGIVVEDGSTYFDGQPITYSEARRIPGDGPAVLTLSHRWQVPQLPDFLIHGSETWLPGDYERLVTLAPSTSWVSRFVDPQRFRVQFTIKEGCS